MWYWFPSVDDLLLKFVEKRVIILSLVRLFFSFPLSIFLLHLVTHLYYLIINENGSKTPVKRSFIQRWEDYDSLLTTIFIALISYDIFKALLGVSQSAWKSCQNSYRYWKDSDYFDFYWHFQQIAKKGRILKNVSCRKNSCFARWRFYNCLKPCDY